MYFMKHFVIANSAYFMNIMISSANDVYYGSY